MSTQECKDAGPPVYSDYKPAGKTIKLDDLPVYTVGKGKKAIIVFYDIFGWNKTSPNVFRVCDRLAKEGGHTVLMADHYRGKPWPVEGFPPKEWDEFNAWWSSVASDKVVKKDVFEILLPYIYQDLKLKTVGSVGFCWGGLMAFELASDDRFQSAAAVHGARITPELVDKIVCPVFYGPAKGDTAVDKIKPVLDKKKFGKKCIYETFANENHGFCAARGDWTNKNTKTAVDKVFTHLITLFKKM